MLGRLPRDMSELFSNLVDVDRTGEIGEELAESVDSLCHRLLPLQHLRDAGRQAGCLHHQIGQQASLRSM